MCVWGSVRSPKQSLNLDVVRRDKYFAFFLFYVSVCSVSNIGWGSDFRKWKSVQGISMLQGAFV